MKKLILTLALFCTGIICTNAQERTNNLPEETKKIINDIKYVDTKNLSDEEAAVVLRVLNEIKEVKVTEFKAVRANDIKNETINKPDLKVVAQHLKNKPMIILDGFEISLEQFDNINPNSVEFIKILTGNAAVSLYGEKGCNGVFIVSSNNKRTDCPKAAQCPDKTKEATVTGFITVRANDIKNETINKPDLKVVAQHLKNKPMIILDGFEISLEQFDNINPNSVEFIKILTGNAAVSLYGEKGCNGVFIVSSNNKRTDCPKAAQCPDKKDCPKVAQCPDKKDCPKVAQCPDKTKEATVTGFITVRANDIKNETINKPDLKVVAQHLKNKPMIILDGFEISYEQFGNINPNSVEFVKILTGNAAVSLYGEKGCNGVFIISSAVQNSSPTVNRLQRPISAINSKVAPIIKKFKQDGNQVSFRLIIPKTDNSKKQQIDIVYQLEN